ncbi:MAG: bifunctional pyr operon transcriptional regulator/uracil phosphoribosyltransferase PyrR [Proteobacteria bacterium]|nr:bifunctional pyr operon transcriptional regulator/uracil phosphoribosyltransferase PyrR [Pseudomonadota bacterium]
MIDFRLSVEKMLDRLHAGLVAEITRRELHDPLMIGIHTGGGWIAEKLHARLGLHEPLGLLNISFYRDDFSQIGIHPRVIPSSLPFRVDGRDIILIDDVLHTGRTIRAALNEIFDYGRPAQVVLGVLIDRNGRHIPVQADCVGGRMDLGPDEKIKLSGPDPLALSIQCS